LVFFSSDAPEAPSIDASATAPASTAAALQTLDGTWIVDTTIGQDDRSGSFVGFRVPEVLERVGETTAVGQTSAVGGQLQIAGATLESALIAADLREIRSDRSRRDRPIQRALRTAEFPTATFVSSTPVELGAIPAPGEVIDITVPGILSIHGVSRDVEARMQARIDGDVVQVVGSLPVDFTDFGIIMPKAPIVVSVANEGDVE
jgi:polyisoprenoid-binding protein YceI